MTDMIMSDRRSPLTRTEYAARIAGEWRKGVLSILEVGRLLNDAQRELPRPEFDGMIAADLPFSKSTMSMLRTVATRFGAVLYTEKLPPSWMTLYLLTRLPPDEFDRRLVDGTINPDLEQGEVRGWVQGTRSARAKRQNAPPPTPSPPVPESPVTPRVEGNSGEPERRAIRLVVQEKSDAPEGEVVVSPPIQPAGITDPLEIPPILDRRASAADPVEEAYCAMVALWRRSPREAQNRFAAFVTAELRAIVAAKHRSEAGHGPNGKL